MAPLCFAGVLLVAGCARQGPIVSSNHQSQQKTPGKPSFQSVTGGTFQGSWKECGELPDNRGIACDGYVLLQNRSNLCGTWEYSATYRTYSGQLQAKVTSATLAELSLICGRPGSETSTECESEYVKDGGWETTDKKLRICEGALSDLNDKNGKCIPRHKKAKVSRDEMRELLSQPWMQTCLARP